MTRLHATYRVQLHAGFTFADAAALAPYLAELGVSHLYCSPVLEAAPGSTHGYDVVDPGRVSNERGGRDGLDSMTAALRAEGLGVVLDIVPNHMAIAGRANAAWWDVWRAGQSSPFARWFDVDWDHGPTTRPALLAPVLGDHVGRLIDAAAITVGVSDDGFVLRCQGHELPIDPASIDRLAIGVTDAVEAERINGDPDLLDRVVQSQHYRLAFWQVANDEVDYRRFFDITTLVGVRVEDSDVFEATHRTIVDLVRSGAIDEIRVDHVDGLRRPEEYLRRLVRAAGQTPVVVEKILQTGERLRPSWPVAGTSGYDFLTRANHLFIDESAEAELTDAYVALTGDEPSFEVIAHDAKRLVLDRVLAAELDRLTTLLATICRSRRRHRDHTRRQLREALSEVIVALRVYRTYTHPGAHVAADDRAEMARAVRQAGAHNPRIDAELLELIGSIVLLDEDGDDAAADLAERFAQVSSAVMAKGVEDTAFYRYHRLISLNEVGGDPGSFGDPLSDFHHHCAHIVDNWPATMLTLATHDTKRAADVRARINVLSEIVPAWRRTAERWHALATRHAVEVNGNVMPERSTRYLLYQTLVGVWPIDADRLEQFALKAAREAKRHTSWTEPDEAYESALRAFTRGLVADATFTSSLEQFLDEHRIVARGAVAALAQTALLLTAPGVPDIYQGSETLDLSLVDPDNRRPVDHTDLRRRLTEADLWSAGEAIGHLTDGGAKQWMVQRLLARRRRTPAPYGEGYEPLRVAGPGARHVVAFRRGGLVVVVPRLSGTVERNGGWRSTVVELPSRQWVDVLTGVAVDGGQVGIGTLLSGFPVAVLDAGAGRA